MRLHILFVTRAVGFPNGMAGTQRVKLLAQALAEVRMDVSILCTQVTERPPLIENTQVKGIYRGIPFEYTTGSTTRSSHFVVRRLTELRGIVLTAWRLAALRRAAEACCVYFYPNNLADAPSQRIFVMVARLFGLPAVVDIHEKPWSLAHKKSVRGSASPICGAHGAVVISEFLRNWVEGESARLGKSIAILDVPILVDAYEQRPVTRSPHSPVLLFAGSSAYDQTIEFILDAMRTVWRAHPECVLAITGCRAGEKTTKQIARMIGERVLAGPVELAGYVPRDQLLRRYSQASALLIPLFDDVRSQARFPTKIGEYLASGRPIVTNAVGEASRFFVDRENAYVCEPGDPVLYGQKIIWVLNNPEEAARVGSAGRRTALVDFHYQNHGPRLGQFIASIVDEGKAVSSQAWLKTRAP